MTVDLGDSTIVEFKATPAGIEVTWTADLAPTEKQLALYREARALFISVAYPGIPVAVVEV